MIQTLKAAESLVETLPERRNTNIQATAAEVYVVEPQNASDDSANRPEALKTRGLRISVRGLCGLYRSIMECGLYSVYKASQGS